MFNLSIVHALGYSLGIKRDDGAVVYLNGREVFRTNMPEGPVSYSTLAFEASDDGQQIQWIYLVPELFHAGANVLAVEVHQSSRTSADSMSFSLAFVF
jgi:hypothetical protein